MKLTVDDIRRFFPALQTSDDVLLDNAGGSQVPVQVADAIREYMLTNYVQLGADYATSRRCTQVIDEAHNFVNRLMNGTGRGSVILGSSATALCHLLADAYRRSTPGDRSRIIVAQTSHEANAGPWYRLADAGFDVQTWPVRGKGCELDLDELESLLSKPTRLVALPHVSNILGRVEDLKTISQIVHQHGARIVADGVAYAPHRAMDVAAWNVDWYCYSTYKVFGPHMAALWGSTDAIGELEGPNHFFIDPEDVPYKFEPGGVSHEGCAGLLGMGAYLSAVDGARVEELPDRATIERVMAHFAHLESTLTDRLITYFRSRSDLTIVGPSHSGADRVCTISAVHCRLKSADVVRAVNAKGFGIRYGHFYAHRLCSHLARAGVLHDVDDGVIRISPLHYNTTDEIDGLIECFDDVLDAVPHR